MRKAIGKIVIVGTMLAMSFCSGMRHAEKMEAKTEKIGEVIPEGYINTESEEFSEHFVDMSQVVAWSSTKEGLQLYFADGSGYYLE